MGCTASTGQSAFLSSHESRFAPLTLLQSGFVYRVQHPGAKSVWSERGGVQAPGYQLGPPANLEFRRIVENHLTSDPECSSPFISVFRREKDATDLAIGWSERHVGQPATLLTIEVASLKRLYNLKELVERLEINTSGPSAQYEEEYLVLHQIPAAGIVQSRTISSNIIWPTSNGEFEDFALLCTSADWFLENSRVRCESVDVDADKLAEEFDKSLHLGP